MNMMNDEQFRKEANKIVDYIIEFRNSLPDQRVIPGADIKPYTLRKLLSEKVPVDGEDFENIMRDFKQHVVPRMAYWGHPQFAAYYPGGSSPASILGDLLCAGVNQLGFSWKASPAHTEHEQLTLNMYAKALDLPHFFQYDETNKSTTGGGAMQSSASDCIFLALLAARHRAVKILQGENKKIHPSVFLPQFVAYTSTEAHSAVEKACKMAIIRLRQLPVDKTGALHGDTLRSHIEHDVHIEGLIPVFVSATVGTTGLCAFDDLVSIGKVCKKYETIWYHVDGAYAGNSFICPELRDYKKGLELARSFNTNPNKFMLTTFDCSCFWVKHLHELKEAMVVQPIYLQHHEDEGEDLRHFGVPLSRRFRSLKLWMVLRSHGQNGLQEYIRSHIRVAAKFKELVERDSRLMLMNKVVLGLVCFRVIFPGASHDCENKGNIELISRINKSGELHIIPASFKKRTCIRYCVTPDEPKEEHSVHNFEVIKKYVNEILAEWNAGTLKLDKCEHNTRFAFARTLPKAEYMQRMSLPHLCDGAEPIYMSETPLLLE